ncbi:hypothetical protein [Arthrobacter sp. TMS1-12-1]
MPTGTDVVIVALGGSIGPVAVALADAPGADVREPSLRRPSLDGVFLPVTGEHATCITEGTGMTTITGTPGGSVAAPRRADFPRDLASAADPRVTRRLSRSCPGPTAVGDRP